MPPSLRTLVLGQIALGDPAVAPTGATRVYTRRIARRNGYRRHVWIVPLDGGTAARADLGRRARLGAAAHAEGDRVLFLRDDQVWAVPLGGGEAES